MHNFIWDSSTISEFRKTNNTIPRKCLDRRKDQRMDRWTDRRTARLYFIRPFWLLLGVQKIKRNLTPTGPAKIGDSLKKMGVMTDQQHLYFRRLFEVSYSIAKRGHPYEEFLYIIELEKLHRVDFSPIVGMKVRVLAETFVLNRFLTKRLRIRSSNIILLVSCKIVQLIQQSLRKWVYI